MDDSIVVLKRNHQRQIDKFGLCQKNSTMSNYIVFFSERIFAFLQLFTYIKYLKLLEWLNYTLC